MGLVKYKWNIEKQINNKEEITWLEKRRIANNRRKPIQIGEPETYLITINATSKFRQDHQTLSLTKELKNFGFHYSIPFFFHTALWITITENPKKCSEKFLTLSALKWSSTLVFLRSFNIFRYIIHSWLTLVLYINLLHHWTKLFTDMRMMKLVTNTVCPSSTRA